MASFKSNTMSLKTDEICSIYFKLKYLHCSSYIFLLVVWIINNF